ncbi:MAG: AMP-binding protein [Proteobacteria bacterium]|nr:AMP-binding protein [Pseudomonadota bacterium]
MATFAEQAAQASDRIAAEFPACGISLTRGELDAAANRNAQAFRSLGLLRGDCVALSIGNRPEFLAAMLGAQRSGLYYVPLSTKLSVQDMRHILEDSGARLVIVSGDSFAAGDDADLRAVPVPLYGIGLNGEFTDWTAFTDTMPSTPLADRSPGAVMLYSSGTTGRPKGVRKVLREGSIDVADPANVALIQGYGLNGDATFYSPCPLYHAAPHRFVDAALSAGAKVIIPDRFDAEIALGHLDRFAVTHSLWVPTMFHRLLRLPDTVRNGHDLSHHRHAVHGAAPCPIHVKRAMIDWWGPILDEYYSGSEGVGSAAITSAEWLEHPGSVGRPTGCRVHILDDEGRELAAGETGDIYFESDTPFAYWNDAEKTRKATNERGWRTFGDVGHVDADGYLYLTDRRHFTIISGGVNIYPQEIEAALLEHEAVRDVAVIGIPDDEFGQIALAAIEPVDKDAAAELVASIGAYARSKLGPVKAPKRIELVKALPRHDTGKLYKAELIERFSRREMIDDD